MKDTQEIYRQLGDILPELAKIMAYDLEHFDTSWRSILIDYSLAFQRLVDILAKLPYGTEEEALRVIKEYIASRQKPYGEWKDADWLEYMLRQIVEKAKEKQRQEKDEPLDDDELPF
jgi:hypothetical protein